MTGRQASMTTNRGGAREEEGGEIHMSKRGGGERDGGGEGQNRRHMRGRK